ncbi:fibronectin type III domain-containing protein [Bizionia sediminis]|uniref:Fibronectin type III domain-containing protein n=1 Tax=Bizionia sediminis TaxID=1737064 RepID=A0ABW5KV77_9FLAO
MKSTSLFLLMCLVLMACSKDDETVTVQQCSKPTNGTAINISDTSAQITWNDSNGVSNFTLEYGPTGFSLGSGTIVNSTNPLATLNNLAANTTYDVYLKTTCTVDNVSMYSEVINFTTAAPMVIPQLLPNLSDLNLFVGNLADLTPSSRAFEYNLNTPLFTDYAHKQRLIALPPGTSLDYVDNDFPDFPDNTLISKTFFYFNDERNEALGKKIIETRILIKINGEWELGNYKWNAAQTDAVLDGNSHTVPVSFTNTAGATLSVNYGIPSMSQCIECHNNNNIITPIGPKLRTMNFNNQLQDFINAGYLTNLTNPDNVTTLPNWEDTSYTLEQRARAYFDVNCAHCHSDGGLCEIQSDLRLTYETPFAESMILERSGSINNRMRNYNEGFSMPLTGTSMVHNEGYGLIRQYLSSLE